MRQCRRTSRDTDAASTAGALLSESEASELFGEYIDEDSQTVHHVTITITCIVIVILTTFLLLFTHVLTVAFECASCLGNEASSTLCHA